MRHRRDRLGPLEPVLKSDRYQGAINVGNSPGETPPVICTLSMAYAGTLQDNTNLDFPYDCAIVGDGTLLAVTAFDTDRITLLDISDPTTPTLVGSVTDAYLNGAVDVEALGTDYVVACGQSSGARLVVIDITTPATPTIVGSYAAAQFCLTVSGNTVFATPGGTLYSIDVATPASPTLLDSIVGAPFNTVRQMAMYGTDYLVCAAWDPGIIVVNVSDPSNISVVGSNTNVFLDRSEGVCVIGDYAVVASPWYDYINVVDISNPASPSLVGSVTSSVTNANKCAAFNGYALVAVGALDKVVAVDISTPASPVIVDSVTDATNLDGAWGLAVNSTHAFVTAQTPNRVSTISLCS